MINTPEHAHERYLEQIAAYLAGGLDESQRADFEAHLAICAACAAALHDARQTDRALQELFADARPEAGLEDRIVQGLRVSRSRRIIVHPAIRMAVSGLAAALLLGTVGYAASELIQKNKLPMPVSLRPPSVQTAGKQILAETEELGRVDAKARFDERFGLYHTSPNQAAGDYVHALREKASETVNGPVAGEPGVTALFKERGESLATGTGVRQLTRGFEAEGTVQLGSESRKAGIQLTDNYDYNLGFQVQKDLPAVALNTDGAASSAGIPAGGTPAAGLAPAVRSGASSMGGGVGGGGYGGFGASAGRRMSENAMVAGKPASPAASYFRPAGGDLAEAAKAKSEVALGTVLAATEARGKPEQLRERLAVAPVDETLPPAPAQQPANAPKTETQTPANPPAEQSALANRKIIRNGEIEFEVDSFDSSFMQISRIVAEEGGFVSSTSSEKLTNGKVRGSVIVRVPPERLDTLVLKLRALGDLKSQKISAQDVTKVYYDLDSELKAARAMEERLLNIIKSGKGEIKDLLEAEKQLGVYREKIEKLEGEIRYYNNLVSLSTLTVTLTERDIKSAAFAAQTEQVNMGVEADDVEKARTEANKAIEEAKGRVIESNLKRHDAGQLAATIVCEVSPDAAGPLMDRLKQIGRVARLEIDRKQTTPTGAAPLPTSRVERKDTRFSISIYNLANVAPRQTTTVSLAVSNVEEAYRSILEVAKGKGGRIVTSNLNRQKPEQTTATISFEVPSAEADATLIEIRRQRDVMSLTVTENPDTNNVTAAKRGFNLQIQSLAIVPPRQTEQLVLATRGRVTDAFNALVDALNKAGARVLVSQLNQQDANNVSGQLDFEVMRDKEMDVREVIARQADTISRNIAQSADAENTVDSKVRVQIRLTSIDRIPPRESLTLGIAARDVRTTYQSLLALVEQEGSRLINSQLNEQDPRNISGVLDFEVLRDKQAAVEKALKDAGAIYSRTVARAPEAANSVDFKVRITVNLMSTEQVAPRETVKMMVETRDVDGAAAQVLSAVQSANGRVLESTQAKASSGEMTNHMVVDAPLAGASELQRQIRDAGTLRVLDSSKNPQAPDGEIARVRFDITLASPDVNEGFWAAVRRGWTTSATGLMWSLSLVVIGLLFVAPWVLLLWGGWKLLRRVRVRPQPAI